MTANYNHSAWFYDGLSRLVYGRALINAQVYFLASIPADANILIVGGGTGWILEEIAKVHPSGLQITYVEVAADMMKRSRKRNAGNNVVVYINAAIEGVSVPAHFDVVITPFLFDNFTSKTIGVVFHKIHHLLKPAGTWLNVDFQLTGKWWQAALLKTMFLFFKIFVNMESSKLPDVDTSFKQSGYKIIDHKTFYGDFVVAKMYRKN